MAEERVAEKGGRGAEKRLRLRNTEDTRVGGSFTAALLKLKPSMGSGRGGQRQLGPWSRGARGWKSVGAGLGLGSGRGTEAARVFAAGAEAAQIRGPDAGKSQSLRT